MIERSGKPLRDLRQRQAALRRPDQPLAPQAVLDGHRVDFLEEERHHRLELRPDGARRPMIVGRHALTRYPIGSWKLGAAPRGQEAGRATGAMGEPETRTGGNQRRVGRYQRRLGASTGITRAMEYMGDPAKYVKLYREALTPNPCGRV